MALTDDLSRLMGFDQGPDNNAEISFKIKPLGSTAASPTGPASFAPSEPGAGSATTGGTSPQTAAPPTAPPTSQSAFSGLFGPGNTTAVPEAQRVRKTNPTLITHPLGGQTDDLYEAAVAQLQFDTQQRYASLLQELGFIDDQGNFIPGLLETEASRQRNELQRQRELSLQDVVESAVKGGTVFSGRRAKLTAQAQQPFDAAIAELGTRLSRELASRYQGLSDLTRQFELGRQGLLAEAAERIRSRQETGPAAAGGPPGSAPPAPAGATGAPSSQNPAPNQLPPSTHVVYDPQIGYYVADQNGQRVGHLDANGMFVAELIDWGRGTRGPTTGAGGGARTM